MLLVLENFRILSNRARKIPARYFAWLLILFQVPCYHVKIYCLEAPLPLLNTKGKIVEEWEEFDTLGVMRQLGFETTLRGTE